MTTANPSAMPYKGIATAVESATHMGGTQTEMATKRMVNMTLEVRFVRTEVRTDVTRFCRGDDDTKRFSFLFTRNFRHAHLS